VLLHLKNFSQREIEQLKEELANLKQLPITHDVHIQTDEE
jgi:hypothetical protein